MWIDYWNWSKNVCRCVTGLKESGKERLRLGVSCLCVCVSGRVFIFGKGTEGKSKVNPGALATFSARGKS